MRRHVADFFREDKRRTRRQAWHVYVLRCANGSLYTGMTNDVTRRLAAHNAGRGARYTRSFGPVTLVWSERLPTRGAALRREAQIKAMSRRQKASWLSAILGQKSWDKGGPSSLVSRGLKGCGKTTFQRRADSAAPG